MMVDPFFPAGGMMPLEHSERWTGDHAALGIWFLKYFIDLRSWISLL